MTMLLVVVGSFLAGVAATVIYNIVFPEKIDKASKELNEELNKHGVEVADLVALTDKTLTRVELLVNDLKVKVDALGDLTTAINKLKG